MKSETGNLCPLSYHMGSNYANISHVVVMWAMVAHVEGRFVDYVYL